MRVLVIEDNSDIATNIGDYLEDRGHVVDFAGDGVTGLHLAVVHDFDVIVLDLTLPGMDGLDVARKLRHEAHKQTPVLMLTARDALEQKLTGFESGADDYMTKPFIPEVLLARLRALHRRAAGADTDDELIALIGHYSVDFTAKTVIKCADAPRELAHEIHLTRTEWAILEVLVRSPGRLIPGNVLHQQVWGPAQEAQASHLRFHLARLRQKLEPEPSRPRQLITEPGMGYRYQP